MYRRDLLSGQTETSAVKSARENIVNRASCEIGVREQSGNNDGKRVEEYLRTVKLAKGNPYCAAFVSFIFAQCGYPAPRTGWSPDLFPASRLTKQALPGNVLGIYFADKKRIAHVGIVVRQTGSWVTSTEANTNVAGSREGDGVYRKLRHIKTIRSLANWIAERRVKL